MSEGKNFDFGGMRIEGADPKIEKIIKITKIEQQIAYLEKQRTNGWREKIYQLKKEIEKIESESENVSDEIDKKTKEPKQSEFDNLEPSAEKAKDEKKKKKKVGQKQEQKIDWKSIEIDMYDKLRDKLQKEYDDAKDENLYAKKLKEDLEKFDIGKIDKEDEIFLENFGYDKRNKTNSAKILKLYKNVISRIFSDLDNNIEEVRSEINETELNEMFEKWGRSKKYTLKIIENGNANYRIKEFIYNPKHHEDYVILENESGKKTKMNCVDLYKLNYEEVEEEKKSETFEETPDIKNEKDVAQMSLEELDEEVKNMNNFLNKINIEAGYREIDLSKNDEYQKIKEYLDLLLMIAQEKLNKDAESQPEFIQKQGETELKPENIETEREIDSETTKAIIDRLKRVYEATEKLKEGLVKKIKKASEVEGGILERANKNAEIGVEAVGVGWGEVVNAYVGKSPIKMSPIELKDRQNERNMLIRNLLDTLNASYETLVIENQALINEKMKREMNEGLWKKKMGFIEGFKNRILGKKIAEGESAGTPSWPPLKTLISEMESAEETPTQEAQTEEAPGEISGEESGLKKLWRKIRPEKKIIDIADEKERGNAETGSPVGSEGSPLPEMPEEILEIEISEKIKESIEEKVKEIILSDGKVPKLNNLKYIINHYTMPKYKGKTIGEIVEARHFEGANNSLGFRFDDVKKLNAIKFFGEIKRIIEKNE
ncbi:MAG: hypothetical protein P1P85_00635 [Patescibacteria group bacterium]|nr:hypothetical protein [Patescibacteria group bacterium]